MAIKVAFFDCDGTLTTVKSSWEYLHRRLGIWDNNADHYQSLFKEGKISYYEFCRRDALLWKGLPVSRIVALLQDITYRRGSREVVAAMKERGIFTVILSTGLSLLVEKVKEDLGADVCFANELLCSHGYLTGEIRINVDYDKKGHIVKKVLRKVGARKGESCALGDGEGDVGMFEAVGLAVGFHRAATRCKAVHSTIEETSLSDIIRLVDEYEG